MKQHGQRATVKASSALPFSADLRLSHSSERLRCGSALIVVPRDVATADQARGHFLGGNG